MIQAVHCTQAAHATSRFALTWTYINFINQADTCVGVYWLDYHGVRQFYALLNPGGHYLQPTFLTHPWVVVRRPLVPIKALHDGKCIAVFLPARKPSNAIIK